MLGTFWNAASGGIKADEALEEAINGVSGDQKAASPQILFA